MPHYFAMTVRIFATAFDFETVHISETVQGTDGAIFCDGVLFRNGAVFCDGALFRDGAHFRDGAVHRLYGPPAAIATVFIATSGYGNAPRWGIPTPAQNYDYGGMGQSPCRDGAHYETVRNYETVRCTVSTATSGNSQRNHRHQRE